MARYRLISTCCSLFAFAVGGLSTSATAQSFNSRLVSSSATELFGYGDLDGSGRVAAMVVDRATGMYRIGHYDSDLGKVALAGPYTSGVAQLDALAIGRITTTAHEQIALSGRLANRTRILSAAGAVPQTVFTTGIGHRSVAVVPLNLPGANPLYSDLVVITGTDDSGDTLATFLTGPDSLATFSEAAMPQPYRSLQRVRVNAIDQDYLLAIGAGVTPGTEVSLLLNPADTSAPPLQSRALPVPGLHMIHGPFRGGNPQQFVFFKPGSPTIYVSQGSTTTFLGPLVAHTLAGPVASVHHLDNGQRMGFVVLLGEGEAATVFGLRTDNGALITGQTLFADGASRFTGAVAIEPGEMSLLTRTDSSGPSTAIAHYSFNGSTWELQETEPLFPLLEALNQPNVLFFAREPFVTPNAALTETVRVPDWTSFPSLVSGSASVRAETLGVNGLGNTRTVALGAVPAGTTHLLTNQREFGVSMVVGNSLAAPMPASVEISPPPGVLRAPIAPVLSCTDPDTDIFYRLDGSGPWLTARSSVSVGIPGATLRPFNVSYFSSKGDVRSPIRIAQYSFHGSPGSMDSNGDGVPDFVKIAMGLDPLGPADSDGDGFSDLDELLASTDAGDRGEYISSWARVPIPNRLNLSVRPLTLDAFSPIPGRPSFPQSADPANPPPTRVNAHDIDGRLLQSALTRRNSNDDFVQASAFLERINLPGRDAFVIISTDRTFPFIPDAAHQDPDGLRVNDMGMELLALIPVPSLQLPEVSYVPPAGADPATAAAAWINAAQTEYASLRLPQSEVTVTLRDTLALLVTERVLALLLEARHPDMDFETFSLTPFRDSITAESVSFELLRNLQQPATVDGPAYLLQTLSAHVSSRLQTSNATGFIALRALAQEMYFAATTRSVNEPGAFPPVVDTLRAFLRGQPLPGIPGTGGSGYAAATQLSASQLTAARSVPSTLAASAPLRPIDTFHARVTADSLTSAPLVLQRMDTNGPLTLLDRDGRPYQLPATLPLLPGTELTIRAFADRADAPFIQGTIVEVLSLRVHHLPVPAAVDMDLNALDDGWERYFFNQTGINPFTDADGDGFTVLEEFLAGTHPLDPASSPAGSPRIAASPPRVDITPEPSGELLLRIWFPTEFSDQVGFRLQTTDDPNSGFSETLLLAIPESANTFTLTLPANWGNREFARFRLFVR